MMNIDDRDQLTESIIREYLEVRGCINTLDVLGPRSEEDTVRFLTYFYLFYQNEKRKRRSLCRTRIENSTVQ